MAEKNHDTHGGNPAKVAGELGFDNTVAVRFDFSVNLNPFGPPLPVKHLASEFENLISGYPEVDAATAEKILAEAHNVSPEAVVAGNGATEVFSLAVQALRPGSAVWSAPGYSGYREVCEKFLIEARPVTAQCSAGIFTPDFMRLAKPGPDMIFLASPNNPTGQAINPQRVIDFAKANPHKNIIFDESFIDFCPDAPSRTIIGREDCPDNLLVVKSLTKFFAVAGLRLGFAWGAPDIIAKLREKRLPWTINGIAQEAAKLLYRERDYIERSRKATTDLREKLLKSLSAFPQLKRYSSSANYVLAEIVDEKWNADSLQKHLLEQGILIRNCSKIAGLDDRFVRLAVRPESETAELIAALNKIFKGIELEVSPPRVSALMLVGTGSNAGKSIMAAGFCKYFTQSGFKVAPFKAQNMALNSFVTREGGEMGRAQVLQAEACGIEPHTDMNPVLLKPSGEARSQVIVNGKPTENLDARNYYERRKIVEQAAREAYDRISRKYDLMILEGAGSPAEINLLEVDFVNLKMAEYAGAAAFLVADIDRGGVFASIYGTVKLLPDNLRKCLKGIIINKFRGDKSLLDSGITRIEELTGIPVLGVMPHLHNLQLDDEDSLGLEGRVHQEAAVLNIAVVRLPRISNYTDFLCLETAPGVAVKYVVNPRELADADMIIIPGTKNTIGDMTYLRESGFEAMIKRAVKKLIPVWGICGGYQILGQTISDPEGMEGAEKEIAGLGLLPVSTELGKEKELAQVSGVTQPEFPFASPGTELKGYEIHMGVTSPQADPPPLLIKTRREVETGEPAGHLSADHLVFGCYIHGLFDSPEFRKQLLNWLADRKGVSLDAAAELDQEAIKEAEFERLAKTLEDNIDMAKVREIIDVV